MSQTVGGVVTNYNVDVLAPLPVVMQDGTYSYVYGLDLISAVDGSGSEIYYTYDGLGSVANLTDATGAVTDSYTYDVFGEIRTSSGSTSNDWLFTGEQEDESGLYFLRARYYDPETGRFISRDPLEFAQRYAYAGNNPVAFRDPSGLCPICIIGIAVVAYYATDAAGDASLACVEAGCGARARDGLADSWAWMWASEENIGPPFGMHEEGEPGDLPRLSGDPESIKEIVRRGAVPSDWTEEELEQLKRLLDESIPNRIENLEHEDEPRPNRPNSSKRHERQQRIHQNRINDEIALGRLVVEALVGFR